MRLKNFLILLSLFLIGISPILISTKLLFLKDMPVWPDEAIYVDTSLTLLSKGVLATNIFGDLITGLNEKALWYPPAYFYLLAGWIKFTNYSIESVRILSFVLGITSLGAVFITARHLFKNRLIAVLGTLLLASDIWFARASRMARMDILSFTLQLFAYLAFFIAEKKQSNKFYFIAGVFCGFSILTHPLGLIAPLTILIYLLIQEIKKGFKKIDYKKLIYFLIPIFLAAGIWFLYIVNDLDLFFAQYSLQFARKASATPNIIHALFNDWWGGRITLIIYGLILILLVFQYLKLKIKYDLFILIGLVTSTIILAWGKEGWYLLYLHPFIIFGLLSLIKNYAKRNYLILYYSIFIALITINLFYFSQVAKNNHNQKDYHLHNKYIIKNLPDTGNVFLSSIPDPYFDLKKNTNLTLFEFPTVPVTPKEYRKLLDKMDYVVMNQVTLYVLADYLKQNTEYVIPISTQGYRVAVFKLLPIEKRSK